jgi:SRSO17 transposase
LGTSHSVPGPQQKCFAAYLDGLAQAAGNADRVLPLKNYCTGLLLPGERKSVEPMAARLAPDNVRRMHRLCTTLWPTPSGTTKPFWRRSARTR